MLMTTFQWLAKGRPDLKDWRGYDLLRIDARADGSPIELRLALEDDVIEPPVVTTYTLPEGRWMTIELDLAAAVRARELDRSKIANFWLLGVAQRSATVRLDNVRLAKRGAPAEREVLRDVRPLTVIHDKPPKPQLPERGTLPGPDRSPIELGHPVVIGKGTHTMFGWVAAWNTVGHNDPRGMQESAVSAEYGNHVHARRELTRREYCARRGPLQSRTLIQEDLHTE